MVAAQLRGIHCHDCKHKDCDGSKGASWFVLDGPATAPERIPPAGMPVNPVWELFEPGNLDPTSRWEDIRYCPLSRITEETALYLKYYGHYKNGYLPAEGGLLDQTARFLRAMEIIDSVIDEYRQEKQNG